MVDSTEAMESQFVTAELVSKSTTKTLVIINPGSYEKTENGKKLTLGVNIDGKEKLWRPNQESVGNMQMLGVDTVKWLGKPIKLKVEKRNGKEAVIAIPVTDPQPPPQHPDTMQHNEEVRPPAA